MPRITLPDGSIREFDRPVTAHEVAADIGAGLAKAALGATINGELCDLSTTIQADATVALITPMDRKTGESGTEALALLRHSCAHVMAEAVQCIIPGIQLVYGPAVENGFYYDLFVPEDRPLRQEDFIAIEKEMARIIAEDAMIALARLLESLEVLLELFLVGKGGAVQSGQPIGVRIAMPVA